MARSRARKARRKARRRAYFDVRAILQNNGKARTARQRAYRRHRQQHFQEDKVQKQDALDYAISGGHFESNRRKH